MRTLCDVYYGGHESLPCISGHICAFLFDVSTKNVNSGQVQLLSMYRVPILNFQPIRFEHNRDRKSASPQVRILGA